MPLSCLSNTHVPLDETARIFWLMGRLRIFDSLFSPVGEPSAPLPTDDRNPVGVVVAGAQPPLVDPDQVQPLCLAQCVAGGRTADACEGGDLVDVEVALAMQLDLLGDDVEHRPLADRKLL